MLLEVSRTKSGGIASCPWLARRLGVALAAYGVAFAVSARQLGADRAGGRRRATSFAMRRLGALRRRIGRFQRLGRAGVPLPWLARAGALPALTYGGSVFGASDRLLLAQRRAVAAAVAAPGKGKQLDMALTLAESTDASCVDPAFPAHVGVIGAWARAV